MDFNGLLKLTLLFIVSLYLSDTSAANSPRAIVCAQTYALCTSARCIPDPEDASKTICECVVQQGKSAGFGSCEKRKPTIDQHDVMHLISTFSFEQFSMKKSMNCAKGQPWSNCVDMPCTVDPQNPKRALCICRLHLAEDFFTFGGNCDSKSCANGFWSGAQRGLSSDTLRAALNKESRAPVTPALCVKDHN